MPKLPVKSSRKCIITLLLIFFLVLLITGVVLWQFKSLSSGRSIGDMIKEGFHSLSKTGTPFVSPSPSPRAIPSGKKGFTVSQGDKTVPQLRQGFIDPYDPAKGGTQTVTIEVKHGQPVSEVTAILQTDNTTSQPYSFKLIDGTNTDGK